MDFLARVPDTFLQHVHGARGGMELVDAWEMSRLISRLPEPPAQAPGGSAANTICSAVRLGLGLKVSFIGKLGSDNTAQAYREHFRQLGGDDSRFKYADLANARCLSLITPDGERTMRTCLSAAITLGPGEISPADFFRCRHAHVEGYLLFNRALADAVLRSARVAGCTISIDLASFEVVNASREWLLDHIRTGVDAVFANEDEIRALFPDAVPDEGGAPDYRALAVRLAGLGPVVAAVKMGKHGAWVARGREVYRIDPCPVARVVDTTGAGDAWAAGFLSGWLRGWNIARAGALGSILGAECVQHLGPDIPDHRWEEINLEAGRLVSGLYPGEC